MYVKLFSSILDSTVWQLDASTRLVWITLLAKADRDGYVYASVPGLASAAKVPLPDCRRSVAILSGPDPDSRTDEHEGRRIRWDNDTGAFVILNYRKYRDIGTAEARRGQKARWAREHRAAQG